MLNIKIVYGQLYEMPLSKFVSRDDPHVFSEHRQNNLYFQAYLSTLFLLTHKHEIYSLELECHA